MVNDHGTRPAAVVVGPPGAGKTTVGQARSPSASGCPSTTSTPPSRRPRAARSPTSSSTTARSAFRDLERAEVARALAEEPGVVALGGGAVMDPLSEAALEGHTVVFLDVAIADASKRIGFDRSRPLLSVNPRGSWIAMMKVRRPTYERVATVRVDTAGRTPDEIVDAVVAALEAARA